jgi:formyltetrahydrofolate hydrolase
MTLRCNDAPGVIHAVSGALLGIGGNVLEQAQREHRDVRHAHAL